ncbi:MAG: hypothetical protein JWN67_1160 [Actinomycetia bacterium]|nr:hypothetical protein [Actinomycetes bacterium]
MRRLLPLLVLAALLAGCSSDGGGTAAPRSTTTSTELTAGLPADLAAFLDGVHSAPFTATYHVLQKLGGTQTDLAVVSDGTSAQIRMGDLVFVVGPKPATCRTSAQRCVGDVREPLLSPTGVFTNFFSSGPARQLATDARRVQAGDPVFSEKVVAGVTLRCAAVPLREQLPSTYCRTPEGTFGWVDTPAVHYELTEYRAGPPGEDAGVPYAITGDGSFLQG